MQTSATKETEAHGQEMQIRINDYSMEDKNIVWEISLFLGPGKKIFIPSQNAVKKKKLTVPSKNMSAAIMMPIGSF